MAVYALSNTERQKGRQSLYWHIEGCLWQYFINSLLQLIKGYAIAIYGHKCPCYLFCALPLTRPIVLSWTNLIFLQEIQAKSKVKFLITFWLYRIFEQLMLNIWYYFELTLSDILSTFYYSYIILISTILT